MTSPARSSSPNSPVASSSQQPAPRQQLRQRPTQQQQQQPTSQSPPKPKAQESPSTTMAGHETRPMGLPKVHFEAGHHMRQNIRTGMCAHVEQLKLRDMDVPTLTYGRLLQDMGHNMEYTAIMQMWRMSVLNDATPERGDRISAEIDKAERRLTQYNNIAKVHFPDALAAKRKRGDDRREQVENLQKSLDKHLDAYAKNDALLREMKDLILSGEEDRPKEKKVKFD
ncbi:hypothetical protein BGW38_006575 [Lunasporangiospora selenospora]|uniref:Uncharacterized protein n=1 Tax=Lunasporangiospora selenospora TaxID=979761 RepID=A0A9P6FLN3_9FUNG|nr:hypothetical protein BGW38_006575 [Lunasporangiospora selenospora]